MICIQFTYHDVINASGRLLVLAAASLRTSPLNTALRGSYGIIAPTRLLPSLHHRRRIPMEFAACSAECSLPLLTGCPLETLPHPPRHWHTNPHQKNFKHSIAPPPPAEELLSVFSSLCAEPFDAAEVRSSLWHLFYVSERFELDQMRQFKQVSHWHFSCHHPLTVTHSSRRRLAAHWSSRGCV